VLPGPSPRNPLLLARALNAFAASFQRHWLAIIVGILLVYALLPFAAPVLKKAGADSLAQLIYQPYKLVCHTFAYRSFFLFGEQLAYQRGEGEGEFERATGINPMTALGQLQAREFQGNEQVGYKVALCQRDVAIYLSIAANGMLFAAVRRRPRPIPWLLFILIGIVPIGLDGMSQLLSQPPLQLLPFRESTWFFRVLTGALFGLSVAWLVFPLIEATLLPAPPRRLEPTPGDLTGEESA
jgi:uncharacterized membrane protein